MGGKSLPMLAWYGWPPTHSCPWCCSFLPPLPALQLNMVKLSYRTAHAKRLSVEQESLHYQVWGDGWLGCVKWSGCDARCRQWGRRAKCCLLTWWEPECCIWFVPRASASN